MSDSEADPFRLEPVGMQGTHRGVDLLDRRVDGHPGGLQSAYLLAESYEVVARLADHRRVANAPVPGHDDLGREGLEPLEHGDPLVAVHVDVVRREVRDDGETMRLHE